jgi:ketosteroid isomerase-like protein
LSSSSPEEPHLVERLFIALVSREPEGILEMLHPQVEWRPTVWSGAEVYRGRDGVQRWLDQFGPGLQHLDVTVEKVRLDRDRGAVLGAVFDSREGGMFAVRVAWTFELEDGLLRRGRAVETWNEALQEAGLLS